MEALPVVIDVGSGYTKMGYGGCYEPSYIIPTIIGLRAGGGSSSSSRKGMEDLDFLIGQEALDNSRVYQPNFPVKHGQIENWDHIERLWEHCFFKYLRCDPQDHVCVLTEPPLNAPENREFTAEIMFETFNIPGMYIAVQALLALTASWRSKKSKDTGVSGSLTGTVIDSGDGVTHVIPVVEGYAIGSAVKHIPLAGRDITEFVQQFMREREKGVIPPEHAFAVAQQVKEKYGYVCKDLAKEFVLYDVNPEKYIKKYTGVHARTKGPYSVDVGYEQFLAPELFFHPEIFSSSFNTPLPEVLDNVIQACPIDSRRDLYKNIVLSGGSTMFDKFGKRLQRDVKRIADNRISQYGSSQKMDVNVIQHSRQRFAVWLGGSILSRSPQFENVCISKAEYEEYGPSVARHSRMFGALTL